MQSLLFASIHLSQYGLTHSSTVLQFITGYNPNTNLFSSTTIQSFYQIVHRNIDKDMAWLLPLLVDKASMIKAQIFVFWKDTADILGRKITNGTKTYR